MKEVIEIISSNRKIQWLLLLGFVIQIITAVHAVGFYYPNEHFQLIEFSSYQLKLPSAASGIWELKAQIRPTFQVYLFSVYYLLCNWLQITDPFHQMCILRIFLSVTMLLLFNIISIYYFKKQPLKILYYVLLILNFSWILPYTRTLFSSEMLSSLLFFGAIFWYDVRRTKKSSFLFLFFIGFIFCFAFYTRFQMAFAIVGFGIWLILIERKFEHIFPIAVGFLTATCINILLDANFYGTFVFTPYRYFFSNIVEGKAASFGTSSFMQYIVLLMLVITAPFLSILLFVFGIKGLFKSFRQPIAISIFLFIFCHCLVGHKEERFLFPIFNALPIVAGWGMMDLEIFIQNRKYWLAFIFRGIVVFSVLLNVFLVLLFALTPYSQTVYFASELRKRFQKNEVIVNCLQRTPLETESLLKLTFYKKGMPNIAFKTIATNDSLRLVTQNNTYVATTYNQIKDDKKLVDSLGYKPIAYSSKMLWNLNEYLHSKGINTINDIWVLYKK